MLVGGCPERDPATVIALLTTAFAIFPAGFFSFPILFTFANAEPIITKYFVGDACLGFDPGLGTYPLVDNMRGVYIVPLIGIDRG